MVTDGPSPPLPSPPFQSPASVMLALTVPVVDRNEENSNWNRWLQILQCALAPVFISLITKSEWQIR